MKAAGDYLRGLCAFDDLYVLAIALAPKLVRDPLAANLAGQIIMAKVDGLSDAKIRSVVIPFVRLASPQTHVSNHNVDSYAGGTASLHAVLVPA